MLPPPLSSLFPYTTLFRSDYYVGLRQRTRIAREQKADFFVSIHADAFTSPRPNGSSVYALSQRGATSETAQWLAASENQRSEEHTLNSSHVAISYAVFCLK